MGNIGIWQLLIVAVIIILLFGTKKLRTLGSDLGSSVKGFKKAMASEEEKKVIEEQEKAQTIANKESAQSKDKEQV
ncbi:MAG: twin-arginine translocase TatA/TatE family subunit [Gammaproteobacteria bacterium]|nr:twin-arginine translocase TatA/TatE family subunit [Gammaproteobacteria bacterium]